MTTSNMHRPRGGPHWPRPAPAAPSAAAAAKTDGQAARLPLRLRQRMALPDAGGRALRLESGFVTVDLVLADARRQIVLVLCPGDVVPPAPAGLGFELTAVVPSTLARQDDGTADAAVDFFVGACRHVAAIGRCTGEERLVALIADLGARLAGGAGRSWSFACPLTRDDMANWLAINPDTLSRLMSRLRTRGLVATPSRHRIVVPDPARLLAASPLAMARAEQKVAGAQP